jgi:hypothetical protein
MVMTNIMQRTYRNRDYQADFAQRLVKAVGYEDAIRECYENQWLGTLIHIQRLQRAYHA